MKKILFLPLFLICFIESTEAQFLEKLVKKVEQTAEKTLGRKVEQKTAEKTEEAFDSTFNQKRESKISLPSFSKVEPAESYAFDHRAEMQMTSGKDVMDIDYFLPASGNFLAALIKD